MPELKVERKTIALSCVNGKDQEVTTSLSARVCGGLAIHKGIGTSKGYTLTHLASSVSLVTGIRLPVVAQEQILAEFAPLMDWTKDYDEIASTWLHDKAVKDAVFLRLRRLRG